MSHNAHGPRPCRPGVPTCPPARPGPWQEPGGRAGMPPLPRLQPGEGGRPIRVAMLPMMPAGNAATRAFCLRPLPYLRVHGIVGQVFLPSSEALYRRFQRPGSRLRRWYAAAYWYGVVAPRRLLHLARALQADVILVQRALGHYAAPPLLELLLWLLAGRLLRRTILYHCDDALYTVAPAAFYRRRLAAAHWVLTGSAEVAAYARRRGARVWRWEGAVAVERYPVKRHAPCRPVTIGWTGHLAERFLAPLVPVLARVCAERDARVRVASERPYTHPLLGERLIWERWTPAREFTLFQDFDIGVMPLADTAYNRAKEGFKLKEYMAAGLPSVCSPVGHNLEIICHGVTGFFATDADAWVTHLSRLIDDTALRASMGAAARAEAEARFSLTAQVDRLAAFLHAVAREQRAGGRRCAG